MRRYLYLAAEVARRRDPQLAAFYDRLVARGKHHTCAVVAVAAKLLRPLYAACKRAAAGEEDGYALRDIDGRTLTRREAAELVRVQNPFKAARAKAEREARAAKRVERRAAQKTRQSDDSSMRSPPLDPVGDYLVRAGVRAPCSGAAEAASAVDSGCAGLRSLASASATCASVQSSATSACSLYLMLLMAGRRRLQACAKASMPCEVTPGEPQRRFDGPQAQFVGKVMRDGFCRDALLANVEMHGIAV